MCTCFPGRATIFLDKISAGEKKSSRCWSQEGSSSCSLRSGICSCASWSRSGCDARCRQLKLSYLCPPERLSLWIGVVSWVRSTTWVSYSTLASCLVLPMHLKRISLHTWTTFTSVIGGNGSCYDEPVAFDSAKNYPQSISKEGSNQILCLPADTLYSSLLFVVTAWLLLLRGSTWVWNWDYDADWKDSSPAGNSLWNTAASGLVLLICLGARMPLVNVLECSCL